jgi:hypothetical protein
MVQLLFLYAIAWGHLSMMQVVPETTKQNIEKKEIMSMDTGNHGRIDFAQVLMCRLISKWRAWPRDTTVPTPLKFPPGQKGPHPHGVAYFNQSARNTS